jgi:hypothetical protein
MNWWPYSDSALVPDFLKSLILLAFVLVARLVLVRAILRSKALSIETRGAGC